MNTWPGAFKLAKLKKKLSRSSGLLAKLRYYVKQDLLWTVYFAIFDSVLRCGIQVWRQNKNQAIKYIQKIQDKTIQILNFKWKNDSVNPLFIYFFYLDFLSQPFTNHRTAGEGGGYFFNSSLPLPPTSQTLRY